MTPEALETTNNEAYLVSKMYKDIKEWAIWSFLLSAAALIFFKDPAWGIVWMITGVLSLKTRIPQMFRLYAALMGCAAVSNGLYSLSGGNLGWSILAVMQVVWTVSLFRQYRKYRQLPLADLYLSGNWPKELRPPQVETFILSRFAKASLLIFLIMFVLFSAACIGLAIYGASLAAQGTDLPETPVTQPTLETPKTEVAQPTDESPYSPVFAGFLSAAMFALALSTAALVPENPRKDLAIVGAVISCLILALYYIFAVIGLLVLASGIVQ